MVDWGWGRRLKPADPKPTKFDPEPTHEVL